MDRLCAVYIYIYIYTVCCFHDFIETSTPIEIQEWRICLNTEKLFLKWRQSAILNLRKFPFWSRDTYLHVILHLRSEFRVSRRIWRGDIAKKQFSIWRPSAILSLKIFDYCWMTILGMEICICIQNFVKIIRGCDMALKLFSKWRPNTILQLRKLPFWSRDLYLHVILHLLSEFHINWPTWSRDIVKFSIWRPSASLNLLWRHHIASENCILCSQPCVKFSQRLVSYFLKYLIFHISAFWLEITYFGLNFDDFWWKYAKKWKLINLTPNRHILGAKHVY